MYQLVPQHSGLPKWTQWDIIIFYLVYSFSPLNKTDWSTSKIQIVFSGHYVFTSLVLLANMFFSLINYLPLQLLLQCASCCVCTELKNQMVAVLLIKETMKGTRLFSWKKWQSTGSQHSMLTEYCWRIWT